MKDKILKNICYTELVYGRINKKLQIRFSKKKIEKLIFGILEKTDEKQFYKKGKNIYVENKYDEIEITINKNTFRIITIDKIKNEKK